MKGSLKKFFIYERHVYESVDDRSLSYVISRKLMEKLIQVIKG